MSVLRQPREQNWPSSPAPGPFRDAFREFSLLQTLRMNMRKTEVRKMMKTQGSTMEFTERNRRALRSAFSLKSAAKAPMYARMMSGKEQMVKRTVMSPSRMRWSSSSMRGAVAVLGVPRRGCRRAML